ncbi:DUF2232 domain-containing protein [Paenibacillus jilunlii]|uniref:Uncharacterized conserved protein YybS, DUF2232 family n=1 Tax=Paenibacillus jilunlii TaxID=682956 RepID=A0A1G9TGE9_9BACL|nr:DUF2232 domain-containing protein [Paenibacillus jilunlii]KWX72001.1 hypothetical protein AML91_22985 [Paenibacillus jilunlii]SDM46831.1 Uncharacterized conserved protein YybS, DUF2232 family [Paenibacillus jilunlii]
MKFRWTSVAWSIAYLLLLLSLSTPLLIITTLFMIIPAVVLFTTLNTKQFIIHILPVLLIVGLITPVYVLIAVYFLIPALVMGRWYKKRSSAMSTLLAGMVTILAEFLLLLLLGTALFNFDLTTYVNDVLQMVNSPLSELGASNPLMSELKLSSEDVSTISHMTVQIIPMTLIISSFMIAVITHSIVRPILNSMEYAVPRMKPAREWRLPRSFIWYYLLGVVLSLVFGGADSGFMPMISDNLLPLLRIAFIIQTIGFLFFLVYERKWSKVVALLLAIPVILMPGLWIIGIVDLAFPLRELVTKSKR